MRGRKHYSDDGLEQVIGEYSNGTKLMIVCDHFSHIPRRTITRGASRKRQNIAKKRPGPDNVLSFEVDSDLVDWVIWMQSQGYPVTRDIILLKVNDIYRGFYGPNRSSGYMRRGWLNRFINQHPLLKTQTAQMIKRVRAELKEEGLQIFTWEFMKHFTKRKMTDDCIFNMDKMGFAHKNNTRKVIAATGSKKIWLKIVEASFHMTIVACVAVNRFSVTLLFIPQGQLLNRTTMDQFSITGSTATVSPKGFMNSNISIKWLDHFSSNVPSNVKRPIFYVYDGYVIQYNTDIFEKAIKLRIMLVLLPSDSTHLIQPLDISVFKLFNTELKHQIEKFAIENYRTSFTKTYAITIASVVFDKGIIKNP